MNALSPREQLDFIPTRSARPAAHQLPPRRTVRDALATFVASLSAGLERRSTIAELNGLSDRELADIGLQRAEVRRVFDPAFKRNI